MSQTSGVSSGEVEDLRKELDAKHEIIGKLQVELKTCRGFLAEAAQNRDHEKDAHQCFERALQSFRDESKQQLDQSTDRLEVIRERNRALDAELVEAKKELETCASLKIELQARKNSFNDLNDNFEQHVQAKIEDAEKISVRLEAELQRTSNEHRKAIAEIKAISLENEELRTIAEGLENDNSSLKEGLEEQEKLNVHLNDINDSLRNDLTTASARSQVLRRERNDLEAQLTEVQAALETIEKSEADIRDTLAEREAEFEMVVRDTSIHNEMLQDNIDDYTRQSNEHDQAMMVKDERIAFLEQKYKTVAEEKQALEDRLIKQQAHSPAHASFDRPMSYRHFSTASHKSLQEELEDEQLSDFDDGGSSDAESSLSESEAQLELSTVSSMIDISPQDIAKPEPISSVNGALVTTPSHQHSSAYSSVSRISSVDLHQAAASKLSLHSETTASFSPLKPKNIALAMFENIVDSISPVEPRRTPLMLSTISEALNSAPATPAIVPSINSTSKPPIMSTNIRDTFDYPPVEPEIAEEQKLSLLIPEHSLVNIDPTPISFLASQDLDVSECFWRANICPSLRRKDASRDTSAMTSSLPQCSSLNPFQRLPAPSGNVNLTEDEKKWPLKDDVLDEGVLSSTSYADDSATYPTPSLENPSLDLTSDVSGSDLILISSEDRSSIQHLLFNMLLLLLGLESTSLPADTASSSIVYIMAKHNTSALAHRITYLLLISIVVALLWRWWVVGQQLWAWEHANGMGFSEGYSNVNNRLGPYGNGHVLLGMLPHNLLSADSPLPIAVVEVVTKTMSAFEGLMGFAPGPTMV